MEIIEVGDISVGQALTSPVTPERMTVSRVKMAMYLAGSLVFVAIGVLLPLSSDPFWDRAGCAFFGFCAVVFAWTVVCPPILLLDSRGFTLAGGFVYSPKQVLWTDVDRFFVYQLSRGGKMVDYSFLPGKGPTSRLAKTFLQIGKKIGGHPSLPRGWPLSPDDLVDKLNGYRSRAMGSPLGHESAMLS